VNACILSVLNRTYVDEAWTPLLRIETNRIFPGKVDSNVGRTSAAQRGLSRYNIGPHSQGQIAVHETLARGDRKSDRD
jgi:hypothetical protein